MLDANSFGLENQAGKEGANSSTQVKKTRRTSPERKHKLLRMNGNATGALRQRL